MKKKIFAGRLLLVSALWISIQLLSCKNKTGQNHNAAEKSTALVFSKGEKITNDNFTGSVYLQNLVESDSLNPDNVASVTFEPGARSKWHLHPAGQILLAIDGVGYYQEKGQPKRILRKGDAIKCAPGILHWHGASADTGFIQVAITGRERGATVWFKPVTDEEYHKQHE